MRSLSNVRSGRTESARIVFGLLFVHQRLKLATKCWRDRRIVGFFAADRGFALWMRRALGRLKLGPLRLLPLRLRPLAPDALASLSRSITGAA
jgi:hypothetical protein